jgi:alkanesulfonate monooxygenase SsuD/methylene tetrahydromethanopterin reductase-like flavin-dependent oxidoreductase (luciferase family)
LEFSVFYEMETPRPWTARSEYDIQHQALAQIELADKMGFHCVWEVEHHFLEEYSHSSAPEVFYGAVSQRTKNIRIGHGVRLLPFQFNNPIKVAEQAATLDILSDGRVEFGFGRSTTAAELDGFSVDYERTREEVAESLEVILKAWQNETLEHDGKLLKIPPRRVVPKPIQTPHPPLWMACVAPDSYTMAGDRGVGVLSFALSWDHVQACIATYRKAIAQPKSPVSTVVNDRFAGLVLPALVETEEERRVAVEGARWFLVHVTELFRPLMAKNKLYTYEYLREIFALDEEPAKLSDEDILNHHMVCIGDAEQVIRKIENLERGGLDQVCCLMQVGHVPHAHIMNSIRRFGRDVIPHFNPERASASAE